MTSPKTLRKDDTRETYYEEDERAPLRPLQRPAKSPADVVDDEDFGQLLKDILVAIGYAAPPHRPSLEETIARRRDAVWFYDRRFVQCRRERSSRACGGEDSGSDIDSWSDVSSGEQRPATPEPEAEAEADTEAAVDPSGKGMYI